MNVSVVTQEFLSF